MGSFGWFMLGLWSGGAIGFIAAALLIAGEDDREDG